jgi:hypothetical protein
MQSGEEDRVASLHATSKSLPRLPVGVAVGFIAAVATSSVLAGLACHSSDRASQYYGELHWSTAWALRQQKFGK